MRIVKEAEERKNEILDVAERLFGTKGFDNTSTNDILNEIGIARGTLYYHFKSKEDILDAMIERMSRQLIKKATDIFNQKGIPVLQRLTMMMMALNVDGNLGQEVMEQVHKPQNALLHQKMQDGLLVGINPLITSLIEEGIAQGICHTDYPAEVAEMTLLYSNTVFDALVQHSETERQQKVAAFIYNLERLLGMERGSMQAAILPIFQNGQKRITKIEEQDGSFIFSPYTDRQTVYNLWRIERMKYKKSNFSKFLLLWAGEFISAIGGGLTSFGLGVYVFQQTGSAGSMALVTLLAFLPTLLLSVPAGVLADRHDRRLLMMVGDGCSAFGILYILLCMMNGEAALWQICVGVFISSTFSALLEPSYRATVTDLLTSEEYSKASGMVSIAGSARYLISPILAGGLLAVSDIKLLLVIDICTFFPTVIGAAVIRKEIARKTVENKPSFGESLRQGWSAIAGNRGISVLIAVSAVMTCFMGTFQTLAQPMILDFADSATLGVGETVCACGMLVSSLFLGAKGIKREYVKILSVSLLLAGIGMIGFGIRENIYLMCLFGFLFFATLPFANNCLDYLVRINIPDELQGRAWGVIGFLSQIGYVVAYALAGTAADGAAAQFHISVGRGAASIVMVAGGLLGLTALLLGSMKSVKALERNLPC